jgi:hypothetical protein
MDGASAAVASNIERRIGRITWLGPFYSALFSSGEREGLQPIMPVSRHPRAKGDLTSSRPQRVQLLWGTSGSPWDRST